ncbi:MAG: hypothetical protein AB7V42_00310 [Thermoleophilia bacterium]
MRAPSLPLLAAAFAGLAATAAGATSQQADAGYLVLTRPVPPLALSPGPGVWNGVERSARRPAVEDLAHRFPRARLHVGQSAVVRLPFVASAVRVTAMRPVGVTDGGRLMVTRTHLDAVLDGQYVSWRISGAGAIIVVYAVDAQGRGTASGRFIGRIASAKSCRGWTVGLRAARRAAEAADADEPAARSDARAERIDALRALLRRRCVSPDGVRRAT